MTLISQGRRDKAEINRETSDASKCTEELGKGTKTTE